MKEGSVLRFLGARVIPNASGGLGAYCPLCDNMFTASDHLAVVFAGRPRAEWLANMVTHYRHRHITSWNKMWRGFPGAAYRRAAHFGDYEAEKSKVNERAKRQLLRRARAWLIQAGVTADDFAALRGTTEETLRFARRLLPGREQRRLVDNVTIWFDSVGPLRSPDGDVRWER